MYMCTEGTGYHFVRFAPSISLSRFQSSKWKFWIYWSESNSL